MCARKGPAAARPTAGGGGGGGNANGGKSHAPYAAQLAAAREEEELRARREAQDIDIPTTLPLFKCAPTCSTGLLGSPCCYRRTGQDCSVLSMLRSTWGHASLDAMWLTQVEGFGPMSAAAKAAGPCLCVTRAMRACAVSMACARARVSGKHRNKMKEPCLLSTQCVSLGCRAHPRYVLQRHIGTYQALRTGAVSVGVFKGELYWLRADLVELHSAEQWLTAGRQARPCTAAAARVSSWNASCLPALFHLLKVISMEPSSAQQLLIAKRQATSRQTGPARHVRCCSFANVLTS